MAELFDVIKADLGEKTSNNFRIFYELMSNQIRNCLYQFSQSQDSEETKGE